LNYLINSQILSKAQNQVFVPTTRATGHSYKIEPSD